MRSITIVSILLVFLFTACQKNSSGISKNNSNELQASLDKYFTALNEIGKFNGVIYAYKDGKEVLQKAYNINTNPSSSTNVSKESQFDIHSISKLMAHYLLLEMEEKGVIQINQKINAFFPDFPNGEKISIEMLLNHSAGFPRSMEGVVGNEIDLSAADILELAKKQKLIFEPGTSFQYSNIGFQIVYAIISKIYDKSFAQCLVDELFVPLKMDDSGAHFYTNKKNLKNLAKNHEKDGDKIVRIDNVLEDETKTARIFSTASDLKLFINQISIEPYASLLKDKNNVIQKDGGSDGIRTQIYTNLDHNYSFILLTNYDAIPFMKTIEDFPKIMEGKSYDIPKAINRKAVLVSDKILKLYTGTYVFPDMNNIELTVKTTNESLSIHQDNKLIVNLLAENKTTFFENPKEAESFEFIKNNKNSYDVLMGWKGVILKGFKK